jgi:YD repeat-containing protein
MRDKSTALVAVLGVVTVAVVAVTPSRKGHHRKDEIVADWRQPPKRHRTPPPRRHWVDHPGPGVGQNLLNADGETPCPKRPGPSKFWEGGGGEWNPCTGNLMMHFLGGLLVFNSERNSSYIHPFHQTGGAPPGGYAGWGFKIASWDQQLTPDDAGNPPASVAIADGDDGQDEYVLKAGSLKPFVYEDKEDKHWSLTTTDQRTWDLETFEGTTYEFTTRAHGILLTTITDKAGNKTTIDLDAATDTIDSVADYLGRKWTFTYTGGNLTQIVTPAPESIKYTLGYDTQGFDDLTTIQLPTTPEGPHVYTLGYLDAEGTHSPFPMSIQSPSGLTTYDYFQDGALVNVFYVQLSQTTPTFHAQYNQNSGSNLVTFEDPTQRSPQTRIVYDATFDQNSGNPTQDFWVTSATDARGITTAYARNGRNEVTLLTDGFGKTWTYQYYANGEDLQTVIDPAGKSVSYTWKAPGSMDGASSGEVATVKDNATGIQETLAWNQATSGVWYHTVDSISDPKITVKLVKNDLADGRHAVREMVGNQLVEEVVLDKQADAIVEDDVPGASEQIALDAYDQPTTMKALAQGVQIGKATLSLDPEGLFQSFTDLLGHTANVGARDNLQRVTATARVVPAGEQDDTFAYADDPSDPDWGPTESTTKVHGHEFSNLTQESSALGTPACADAVAVDGTPIPIDEAKFAVAGVRVACGSAPTPPPPPPPPGDGGTGMKDAGAGDDAESNDAGWTVDAPPDVAPTTCPAPTEGIGFCWDQGDGFASAWCGDGPGCEPACCLASGGSGCWGGGSPDPNYPGCWTQACAAGTSTWSCNSNPSNPCASICGF